MTLQRGANTLICAKAPAVFPTTAFVPPVEGENVSRCYYEKSFDLTDALKVSIKRHWESKESTLRISDLKQYFPHRGNM